LEVEGEQPCIARMACGEQRGLTGEPANLKARGSGLAAVANGCRDGIPRGPTDVIEWHRSTFPVQEASAMWLVFARAPQPDVDVWLGRRALAAADAAAWPIAWIGVVYVAPVETGAVGTLVVAVAFLTAARRLHRALLANHRYHFTTWKWGWRLIGLLAMGAALKLAAVILPH
jgi:hypothetical protein